MRAILVGLVLLCLVAATGCGTVGNVLGPRQDAHLFGGVEFDCLALQSTMSGIEPEDFKDMKPAKRRAMNLLFTGMIALDFPLSFVGDTITLPSVLLGSGKKGWDLDAFKVSPRPAPRETEADWVFTPPRQPATPSSEPTPAKASGPAEKKD